MKRSFGRSSRQKLIEQLQFWNDALKLCFEKSEIPLDSDTPNSTLASIKGTFDAQSCVAIREQVGRMHDRVLSSWRCGCPDHKANLRLTWHTDGLPEPRKFNVLLSYLQASTSDHVPSDVWQQFLFEVEDPSKQAMEVPAIITPSPAQLPAPDPASHPRKRFKAWFQAKSIQVPARLPDTQLGLPHFSRIQSSQPSPSQQQPNDSKWPIQYRARQVRVISWFSSPISSRIC